MDIYRYRVSAHGFSQIKIRYDFKKIKIKIGQIVSGNLQ